MPILAAAPEIRKVIHTTNAIGSLSHSLRKVTRNRQAFSTGEATSGLIQGLRNRASAPDAAWNDTQAPGTEKQISRFVPVSFSVCWLAGSKNVFYVPA